LSTVTTLVPFLAVVGLLTLTPGMDTALILRTAAIGAPRRAWGVVAGIQGGTLVWGVLTSAGVTALLTASHVAYTALRWVGAAYLVWMGVTMILASRRATPATTTAADAATGGFPAGLRRGLLTNLLNPKMGAFYVALLPQFIPAGAAPLAYGVMLTGVHILLGAAWSAVLIVLANRVRATLQRPVARRILDRVTGTVIAVFGIRLATATH
jgi:threonine/homoserine/homoserine lactone efflux protein